MSRECRFDLAGVHIDMPTWPFENCESPSLVVCPRATRVKNDYCHGIEYEYDNLDCALEVLRDGEGEFEVVFWSDGCQSGVEQRRYRVYTRNGERAYYLQGTDYHRTHFVVDGGLLPPAEYFAECLEANPASQWMCLDGWDTSCAAEPRGCECSLPDTAEFGQATPAAPR